MAIESRLSLPRNESGSVRHHRSRRSERRSYKADQTEFKLPGNYTTRAVWTAKVRELTGARSGSSCGTQQQARRGAMSEPEPEPAAVVIDPARFTHQIGKYLFDASAQPLGVGGYGNVYSATHCETGEEVAVKLALEQTANAKQLTEIMCQQACQAHEFVVPIKDILYEGIRPVRAPSPSRSAGPPAEEAQPERQLVVVMEKMGGGELFDEVKKERGLSEDRAKVYFRQILLAMAHVHAQSVAHGDCKLQNILLNDDKTACKVCDFGLAKHVSEAAHTSSIVGKAEYVAPEVLKTRSYDPQKADIWSCGVVLYCMLECQFPFPKPATDVLSSPSPNLQVLERQMVTPP